MSDRIGTGHHGVIGAGVFLDHWGAGPLLIRTRRRKWFFEFSEMFGPVLLRKDFEPATRQPTSETDPFWFPFQRWMDSGRKVRHVRDKHGRVKFSVCHWPRSFPGR